MEQKIVEVIREYKPNTIFEQNSGLLEPIVEEVRKRGFGHVFTVQPVGNTVLEQFHGYPLTVITSNDIMNKITNADMNIVGSVHVTFKDHPPMVL